MNHHHPHKVRSGGVSSDALLPYITFECTKIAQTSAVAVAIFTAPRKIAKRLPNTTRKEPEGKSATEKNTSENFPEEKMFAELYIPEDFSKDRRYHFYWILEFVSGYLRNLQGRFAFF